MLRRRLKNIRNGSYPYTVDVYMVTVNTPTQRKHKSWWTGFYRRAAAALVQDVGYVPPYPAAKQRFKWKMLNYMWNG